MKIREGLSTLPLRALTVSDDVLASVDPLLYLFTTTKPTKQLQQLFGDSIILSGNGTKFLYAKGVLFMLGHVPK